jgi:hypothetical protein
MLAVSLRAAFCFDLVWIGLFCFVSFRFVLFCPRALHSADVALAPLSHIDSAAAEQSWAVVLSCASSDSIQPDASYTDGRVCTKVTRRYKLANQNALQTCKPKCGSGCVVARAVESRAFAEQRMCV